MQQSGYGFVDKLNLVESLLWQGVWVTQWSVYWLLTDTRGGMAQWVARGYLSVVSSSAINGPRCFLEQETLLLLLSTGWFQERIRA